MFYGLCFDPDGQRLFASGAETSTVHQFRFSNGYLTDHVEVAVGMPDDKLVPTGMCVSRDGKTLLVACAWGDQLSLIPLDDPSKQQHVRFKKDSYPYLPLTSGDGKRLYVSLWGRSAVAVLNLDSRELESQWPTQPHPTEMRLSPKKDSLYVACANSNTSVVLDTTSGKQLEIISSALHPQSLSGSTPNSIDLSADGKVLLVANADNNNVAVIDVSQRGRSHSLGFIPAGWYPTSVRFGPKGEQIYIANGKGLMPAQIGRGRTLWPIRRRRPANTLADCSGEH